MSNSPYSQQDIEPLLEALRDIAASGSGTEAQKAKDALQRWDASRQNTVQPAAPVPSPSSPAPAAPPARKRYKPEPLC